MLSALLNQTAAWAQGAGGNATPDTGTDRLTTTACVDPRATIMLTDKARSERHGARWRAGVWRRGRCFAVQPGEHWERITGIRGGLVIMRRTPPSPGVPPLYFRVGFLPVVPDGSDAGASRSVPDAAAQVPVPEVSPGAAWDAGSAATPILVEALPPPPTPAVAPAAHAAIPAPARSIPVQAARAQPGTGTVPPVPESAVAGERSYAIGFVIAIFLVTLLLAAVVLLMHALLRRSPGGPQQPSRPDPVHESMLPILAEESRRAALPSVRAPRSEAHAYDPGAAEPPGAPKPPGASQPDIVVRRSGLAPGVPDVLRSVGLPSLAAWPAEDEADRRHCVMLLRKVGWHASIQPVSGRRHASIIAHRGGRLMVLHCLPATVPVDEQSVEESCMAREREQADLAVIVSNAGYTASARQLAARIGVDLLHEDELRAFAA